MREEGQEQQGWRHRTRFVTTPQRASETLLREDAIEQTRESIHEGGCGLTGTSDVRHAAYSGRNALVLARAVATASGPDLTVYLARLPHRLSR